MFFKKKEKTSEWSALSLALNKHYEEIDAAFLRERNVIEDAIYRLNKRLDMVETKLKEMEE